ncbi:DUF1704 domain-containing protein [Galbibacter sp. BG1]|uniref:flavohemoglobin expression-modulating QEGLA motif protein n=1 Tax=Galbibacter sp. BG1 TaxID=1170699 RepID=UPI0015BCE834|nr:tyrosine/phenylalanine carboxypeptidase domain-containing protein [Galbibacter sp. BG1]QLE00216.1 DUF1704 domain-containing protein [Galbibacter sp. BG1]
MWKINHLEEKEIKKITNQLAENKELNCSLPGGGLLHIEPGFPYLVVYRRSKKNNHLKKIAANEASYLIIGNKDFKKYQKLIIAISDLLSTRFKSYMLLELFLAEKEKTSFCIKGPEDILPSTLNTLQEALQNIPDSKSGAYFKAAISNTRKRQPKGKAKLLTITKAKQCGALVVGLEIPSAFNDEDGVFYPLYFRDFKDSIIEAIHLAVFDFIRVQTSCGVRSVRALGRQSLKDKVYEIDKKLSRLERSYKFLWLVSPSNIHNIKKTFFNSGFEKILDYHYRLLPVDPDLIKRRLYNLKIEDVDDPAMSHLFREKREELDQQISMLSERGSPNFFYNGLKLYGNVDDELLKNAQEILRFLPNDMEEENRPTMDAREFASFARKEFQYFHDQDDQFKSKIHLRKDVNIMMVNQGELYIPADYKTGRMEAKALIQHEVGTHVLTYFNGSKQPFEQLSIGLADYDTMQEGVAVMAEYLSGGLTVNRLRILAGRVVAGKALIDNYDFRGIFQLLFKEYGFSKERAFNITSRIMQGGGFLKDIIYLKGLVKLRNYLKEGGSYELLFTGKFAFHHVNIIKELTDRKVLQPPALIPSYAGGKLYENRLKDIRDGLPIHKMVSEQEELRESVSQ